ETLTGCEPFGRSSYWSISRRLSHLLFARRLCRPRDNHYRIHREGSRHVEDLPPFPALLSFSPLRPFRRPPSSLFQNRPSWISSSIGCAAEVGAAWTRRQLANALPAQFQCRP